MSSSSIKKASAVIGAVALVGAGAASVAPAFADTTAPSAAAVQTAESAVDKGGVSAVNMQGFFSYDQSATSSSTSITKVFAKASATLCMSMPSYGAVALTQAIAVSGDVDSAFAATVAEMAADADARAMVMACACASNIPGGGAIINAEVSGVPLESIADRAGA